MWKLFFEICYFLTGLIPIRSVRNRLRMEKLFDWKNKYRALKKKFPELKFRNTRMIKGGWNIGFIVDKKYVFKIRKIYDAKTPVQKINREKRITDAFANISPLRIPHIEIIRAGKYTFYKYDFIAGKNLNTCSVKMIKRHADVWGRQLAEFIYAIHNAYVPEIDDLRNGVDGDGWNHNDMCNNMIIDRKTKQVVGVIDWEYANWGFLDNEFNNTVAYSSKMKKSGIIKHIKQNYAQIANAPQQK